VVATLKSLQVSAKSVVQFLSDPNLVKQLRQDKSQNLAMLQQEFNIGVEQIEALYHFAKFQFDCGNYSGASEFLYHYRMLCTNPARNASALWGKLAAEILLQNWDQAIEDFNRLKENIDKEALNFESQAVPLVQRTWLMHWALFIFFNHENGRNMLVDLYFQEAYLNALQADAQHLLRYLAVAVVVNKRKRSMLKELIKVIPLSSPATCRIRLPSWQSGVRCQARPRMTPGIHPLPRPHSAPAPWLPCLTPFKGGGWHGGCQDYTPR